MCKWLKSILNTLATRLCSGNAESRERVLGKALEVDVSYSDPADQPFFGTCNREIHKVVAISDHIAMPHEEATTN
jgi:hypothetical protein